MPDRVTRRSIVGGSALLPVLAPWLRAEGTSPTTSPATRPAGKPGGRRDVPARMSFISNDRVRLGIDLALGGAITHLSPAGAPDRNVVNSHDLGRQVQMSYYAGPVPYAVPGHAGPPPQWRHIGWNPIQVGDDFGNPSKVLDHRNNGRELYVKCVPMQWPLDDVPGECTFECWATLDGPAVRVRCRLTMDRTDKTQWPARTQELPAVYTNGPWYRLFSYTGERPFTGAPLQRIEKVARPDSPWAHYTATERWAALVDDDRGLGVWNPACVRWAGGFAGKPGSGGPKDKSTGYISPTRPEILDPNLVHEYAYALVPGTLTEIRDWAYRQGQRPTPAAWAFERDRQGWTYRNATDAGWPIRGGLDVDLSGDNPQGGGLPQLVSPADTWHAADAPRLTLEAAFAGDVARAAVYWATSAEPEFSAERVVTFPVTADGQARAYAVDLAESAAYRGLITQVRIDPLGAGRPGDRVRVKAVRLGKV